MNETLKDLKKLAEAELKKINVKGDLTPVELDNAMKAVCLIQKIDEGEDPNWEMNDNQYSEAMRRSMAMRSSRNDRGMSGHGWDPMYDDMIMRGRSMDLYRGMNDLPDRWDPRAHESMAQRRDSETGQFMSGNGYTRGNNRSSNRRMVISYDNGYSGHSIDDRIVDELEHMMDSAETNYEREKLNDLIRYVDSKRGR